MELPLTDKIYVNSLVFFPRHRIGEMEKWRGMLFNSLEQQIWHFCPEKQTFDIILLLWKSICCCLQKRLITITLYFSRNEHLLVHLMHISAGFERITLVY